VAINHLWCACRRRDSSSRQDSQDSKDSQDTPLHWFPWRTGNLATEQPSLLFFTGLSGWAALIQQPGLRIIRQLINCLDKLPLIGQLSTESSDFCHIPLEEINKVLIKCQLSALKSLIKTKPVFLALAYLFQIAWRAWHFGWVSLLPNIRASFGAGDARRQSSTAHTSKINHQAKAGKKPTTKNDDISTLVNVV